MVEFKSILNTATKLSSIAMLDDNVKFAQGKDKSPGKFAKQAVKNIIIADIIKAQSKVINS